MLKTTEDDSNPSLEDVLKQPHLLVGQRIRHRFVGHGQLVWYLGTVQDFCATSKEFTVLYDNEEESCGFTLLDDIKTGNIVIL